MNASATQFPFGILADGTEVKAVELMNGARMRACILTYGATLQSLSLPGAGGESIDVVLGYDTLQHFVDQRYYMGATIGRFANRIASGAFSLDGRRYELARNDGPNSLHGGVRGFDKIVWTIARLTEAPEASVTLHHISPDGDEGFPGALDVSVTYTLRRSGELAIAYRAVCDKPTIVNLSHHSLFALGGRGACNAILTLDADRYLPVDNTLIPLGRARLVAGTPFDFRQPALVGARLQDMRDPQLAIGRGFDHNFVLNGGASTEPKFALRLEDAESCRAMELFTTEPGIQFYSGNFLNADTPGKHGGVYHPHDGLAFEPQHFPDSPNRPEYPSTRLNPGQVYAQETIFRFS